MTIVPQSSSAIRLLLGIGSGVLASLTVVKARTSFLWKCAIAATEWGHVLAVPALVPLLPGWRRTQLGRIGGVLAALAAVLLITPLLRALLVARQLPSKVSMAFGSANPPMCDAWRVAPLVVKDVLWGARFPRIHPQSSVYVTRGEQQLALDIYRSPAVANPRPAIVVIHGGSWHHGSSKDLAMLNHYLAAQGYVVASVNYRFAPANRFPAALEDVLAAVEYLKANASTLKLDPQRLALLGRSSGGHLGLLAAYTANDPAIRGVVSFYAPPDLQYSYEHPSKFPRVFDTKGVLHDFLGGSLEQVPLVYQQASPVNFVDAATPPTLLIHGGRDEFVDLEEVKRLDARLEQFGVPHLLVVLPWATHGGDFNFSGPSGQISTYAIERFLAAVFQRRSPSE